MPGKPSLDILLGMGPPKGASMPGEMESMDDGDMDGPDSPPDEMLVGAAQDVMSAMHERDPEAFASALKSFVDMAG